VSSPFEGAAERAAEGFAGRVRGPLGLSRGRAATGFGTARPTSAPPGVAESLRQAQGGGRPLSQSVRAELEPALGADLSQVRVHTDARAGELNRSLDARASTVGADVFLGPGEDRPRDGAGRRLLAHELAHVAQGAAGPGARMPAAALRPARPGGSPWAPLFPGLGGQPLLQRLFKGPQFKKGNRLAVIYAGHHFDTGPRRPKTACGTKNEITTAGEHLNNGTSKPGTPLHMARYKSGFARSGGLVRDKNLAQAATKMHLINHRLENSGNTQRTSDNIMLGTAKSNNPIHLHAVEEPVIRAVSKYGSRQNGAYEGAMAAAGKYVDPAGNKFLYWAAKPSANAVKHKNLAKVMIGGASLYAMQVKSNTPSQNFRHLWLEYQVKANYGLPLPGYVLANIAYEQAKVATPAQQKKIDDFTLGKWAQNAFPSTFECYVEYYSATYDPWNGIYRREREALKLRTDY
jgi:hypothetical protein